MVNGQAAVLLQVIAGAAPASVIFCQYVPVHQVGDVAQSSVRGAFGDLSPFRGSQRAVETVQKPVDEIALTVAERLPLVAFPETRLRQNGVENFMG